MTDVHTSAQRSANMSAIRSRNTKPELLVRRMLFAQGFRYRLHVKKLPGAPDLVLTKYRTAIFVHGCFWHGHNCHLFRMPQTRREFWETKIGQNIKRDANVFAQLRQLGWRVLVVWECGLKGRRRLSEEQLVQLIGGWIRESREAFLEVGASQSIE